MFTAVPVVAFLAWQLVPRTILGLDGWRWVVIVGWSAGICQNRSSRQVNPLAARSNVLLAAMIVVPKYLLAPSSRDATFTVSPITV